jgi:hypothetical protein
VPTVPSRDCSFDQRIAGGVVGEVKPWAETQRVTVVDTEFELIISSVEVNSLALFAVPGELLLAENNAMLTPLSTIDGQKTGPALSGSGLDGRPAQSVMVPPLI